MKQTPKALLCPLLLYILVGVPSFVVAQEEGVRSANASGELGVLEEREIEEEETVENPYVFVAHKQNYVLPVSYTTSLNSEVYDAAIPGTAEFYRPEEIKFQLSLKVQLNNGDLFYPNDALQAGLTLESWWQLYSTRISSPFRETNYQPEVFYSVPSSRRPFGLRPTVTVGIEHQSNGQVQSLSRSWNRIYLGLLLEGDRFYAQLKPWYRIPEPVKTDPESPRGDDNPDIQDFFGYGELSLGWRGDFLSAFGQVHGNPVTGKGAISVSVSFPLFQRFRGVVHYFNGYGDSLIDYDNFQQRLGLGILLSNLF